jgi:hypothetical protein
MTSARQLEIMTNLNMEQGLVGVKGSCASLEVIWKRYVTITKAISRVGEVDWELGKKPVEGEIIGVYCGKSAFYDQVKVLQHVRIHSAMVEWLERPDFDVDSGMASDVWGFYKAIYTLKDLEKWLVEKQKQTDRKGKQKEKEIQNSPPSKRIHKKSVGGRK